MPAAIYLNHGSSELKARRSRPGVCHHGPRRRVRHGRNRAVWTISPGNTSSSISTRRTTRRAAPRRPAACGTAGRISSTSTRAVFGVSTDSPGQSPARSSKNTDCLFRCSATSTARWCAPTACGWKKTSWRQEVDGHRTLDLRDRPGRTHRQAVFRRVKPDEHAGAGARHVRQVTALRHLRLPTHMETKSSFLHLFEKLEGFVGKLPGSFAEADLAGDRAAEGSVPAAARRRASCWRAIPPPAARDSSTRSSPRRSRRSRRLRRRTRCQRRRVGRISPTWGAACCGCWTLRITSADEPLAETTEAALATESPDAFLFLHAFGANPTGQEEALLQTALDRLEAFLDFTESRHQVRPAVLGVVVNPDETEASAAEMEAARARLHVALTGRPKIAKSLAPTRGGVHVHALPAGRHFRPGERPPPQRGPVGAPARGRVAQRGAVGDGAALRGAGGAGQDRADAGEIDGGGQRRARRAADPAGGPAVPC